MSHYLAGHPEIFMSEQAGNKEPGYFAPENPSYTQIKSAEEYFGLFNKAPSNAKYIGEASVNYLRSKVAVKRILEVSPEAKFIVMVRNPIEIARSRHGQLVKLALEPELDFEKAWRLQEFRQAESSRLPLTGLGLSHGYQYGEVSKIGAHLERVMNDVPVCNLHIIVFDDFAKDPSKSYAGVLKFLRLKSDNQRIFQTVNPGLRYRSELLQKVILRLGLLRDRLRIPRGLGIHKIINRFNARPGSKPLKPLFHAELLQFFVDDIQKISRLLDRDLTKWTENN